MSQTEADETPEYEPLVDGLGATHFLPKRRCRSCGDTTNPPRLRIQPAVHGPMCRSCTNYDGRDRCTMYDVIVAPNVECDSWDSIYAKGKRQYAEP